VLADIGFAYPEREQTKAHLQIHSSSRIAATQIEAGAILGIKQPHVSALTRNRSTILSRTF
jgi:hypothetical protein